MGMLIVEKEIAMNFDDLSAETKAKLLKCKSPEDILELAKSEGIDLTDEQIEGISGGGTWDSEPCHSVTW